MVQRQFTGSHIPALIAEGIHKSFGDVPVLNGVSLSARDGDVISLIGASGSGKSTFLRCLNFLEVPDSGRILVGGDELAMVRGRNGMRAADRRQLQRIRTRLAMMFQNFNLWPHRTVLENVIEVPVHVHGVPRTEAIEIAEDLLARVGLAEKRNDYPGFLSGGQQQRAAIARALAIRPRILLFDEPTSALDPELVGEVLKVIRSLAEEGRTMILVTHEMRFAREVSSRVMFLHRGKVEDEGPPEQLFSTPASNRCRQFLAASV